MDVKGIILLQLFYKSNLRNRNKTYLEQKFFSIVKFKKLGFRAPLISMSVLNDMQLDNTPQYHRNKVVRHLIAP